MTRRKKPAAAADSVRVRLPTWRGALRCGTYQAGVVYAVEPDEAERLVRVKGFEVVGDEPGDRT